MKPAQELIVLSGAAHGRLAQGLAHELGLELGAYGAQRFPDGEMYVEVGGEVRGKHVVLVQPMAQPVGDHLLELLLMSDACRRSGARAISAVLPYLAYARQDHRTRSGQALSMRVVGDLLTRAELQRVYTIDLHSTAVEGFVGAAVEHMSAATILAQAARKHVGKGAVVVAPDLGAAKLAGEYARILELPMAIVHKTRLSPREVAVVRVFGHVRGMRPIIVDDMITTGATVAAAVKALEAEGAVANEAIVAATHALFVDDAVARFERVGVSRVVTTDTLPMSRTVPHARAAGESSDRNGDEMPFAMDVVSVAPLLAEAVRRVTGGHK